VPVSPIRPGQLESGTIISPKTLYQPAATQIHSFLISYIQYVDGALQILVIIITCIIIIIVY